MRYKIVICMLAVVQIFLLTDMIFASGYFLGVSAEPTNCCPETTNGEACKNVELDYADCTTDVISTTCDSYPECDTGCCIDEEEGLCTTMSQKVKCESDGGKWVNQENCLVADCVKRCCIIGDEAFYVTEKRCEKLSALYGLEMDFRNLRTQYECLAAAATQAKGACVFEDRTCSFGTESECFKAGGVFSEGDLCSKESLNTTCEAQVSIGCVEGKDEIYWMDSCGNYENIYSSDKEASWNSGEVLTKNESCGAGESNADSKTCGNCDYYLGSRCSETSLGETHVSDGNFVCEDLRCTDEEGNIRQNGESWCIYDSYIGDGKDPVGSRHWVRMCVDGKVVGGACDDYRGEVCTQAVLSAENSSEKFSIAGCVANEATKCISYNYAGNFEKLCNENTHCVMKHIDVSEGFKFDVCVPAYPKGFDLEGGSQDYDSLCGMASQECYVVYEKDWKGHWDCKQNCNCKTAAFAQQMNDLCISLGDCGTYINYLGDGTDNANVGNSPNVGWLEYASYANKEKGQFVEPQNWNSTLEALGIRGIENLDNGNESSSFDKAMRAVGTIAGGTGTVISAVTFLTGKSWFYAKGYGSFMGHASAQAGTGVTNVFGTFAGVTVGLSIGLFAASMIAKWRGISGDGAKALTFSGAVAGAIAGYGFTAMAAGSGFSGFWEALGPVLGWTMIIAIAIMAYIAIIGWGQTKVEVVSFECYPWEAPLGGDKCSECNNDPLKPCSEYRCSSLGQACELILEDTETPICQAKKDDLMSPVISPGNISAGYMFSDGEAKRVAIKKKNGECIPEFTPVVFSLSTDEFAQCKYSMQRTGGYDLMTELPLEGNKFTMNHSFIISMPSFESLEKYGAVSEDLEKAFAKTEIFVRCRDYYGNENIEEYAVNFCVDDGPDLTPPVIVKTNPESGGGLAYGETTREAVVYVNEPADCRFDYEDNIYSAMSNEMSCNNELTEVTDFGWTCLANMTELGNKENKIYMRCKDKPWLKNDTVVEYDEETEENITYVRNVNTESFVYTLFGTEEKLKTTIISPGGKIETGFEPKTIEIQIETEGGFDDGAAECYYKFGDSDEEIPVFETFSDTHKQTFDLAAGDYELTIRCEDSVGNVDTKTVNFTIEMDITPPTIVRAYNEGGNLIIVTDEDSECYYNFERCSFDNEITKSMSLSFAKVHSTEFAQDKTYYIKCEDIWGNSVDGCSIQVKQG